MTYQEPPKNLKYSKSDISPDWAKWADIEIKNLKKEVKDIQELLDSKVKIIDQKDKELSQKDKEIENIKAELEAGRAIEALIPKDQGIHVLRELDALKIQKSTRPALWVLMNKLKKEFEWNHEENSMGGNCEQE